MKPVLQALVLAERIYEDRSGKKIICGTFNQITVAHLAPAEVQLPDGSKKPVLHAGTDPGCPSAYLSLTDVVDGTELIVQFANISKNEVVFQASLKINVKSRLETVEIVMPLPPMPVFGREAGTFSLDVIWNGEILGSHRVLVIIAQPKKGPGS